MSLKTSALKSKKTTIAGILAFIGLAATQAGFIFDADPLTVPDWGIVAAALASLIMGLFARDSDVSSETAEAK